ncbi:MAG: hypothetical protein ACFNUG_07165 [Tannerella forsythia]|uniref:hypothetical protein n=1 Tax=Tannerella forsythia TaxID=28112 RepID=UPI0036117EF1
MKQNVKVQSVIESLFLSVVERLTKDHALRVINSLGVQLDLEAGEIQIFDEQERLLRKKVIFDWADSKNKDEAFTPQKIAIIRSAINKVAGEGAFEHSNFMKPFVIRLTNEDFSTIEALYSVEDTPGEGDLLKSLDRELKDFYRKLFSDVE